MRLRVGHQHSQFLSILTRFVNYYSPFLGPKAICMVVEPKARLRGGHQQAQLWPILARLMDYYSPIWGPAAIPIVVEPQGVLTCRSSTLAVLTNSGLFHGLLLTVLQSQSDFDACRTPRCAYVLDVKTRRLGRFWPVSWTITQFWGPEVISTIDEHRGAFTCRSPTLTILADSGTFSALLLTVVGSRSNFHD